jgi:hypothetical protein
MNEPHGIGICDNGLSTLNIAPNIYIIGNSNADKGCEDHYLLDD